MSIIRQAIEDPFSVQWGCALSLDDTERHLRVKEWDNDKLSRHIKIVLVDEIGRKMVKESAQKKMNGLKMSPNEFFDTKLFKKPIR